VRANARQPQALIPARAQNSMSEYAYVTSTILVGPGCPQAGFSALRYVSMGFRTQKNGPADSPPPPVAGAPPVLGSLVRSAEGLPSTRNWPFRWPLPPTSRPAPGDTQGNVSRQLAGAVVLGGGAAPAPPLAGSARSCASSIRVPKKNARCPARPSGAAPEGLAGMAELRPLSVPGRARRRSKTRLQSSVVSPRGSCPSMTTESLGQMFIFHSTSDVANRDHRPSLDYLGPTRRKKAHDQRKT
jgi:hypothetical protein